MDSSDWSDLRSAICEILKEVGEMDVSDLMVQIEESTGDSYTDKQVDTACRQLVERGRACEISDFHYGPVTTTQKW